jgi:hypothetical protein
MGSRLPLDSLWRLLSVLLLFSYLYCGTRRRLESQTQLQLLEVLETTRQLMIQLRKLYIRLFAEMLDTFSVASTPEGLYETKMREVGASMKRHDDCDRSHRPLKYQHRYL